MGSLLVIESDAAMVRAYVRLLRDLVTVEPAYTVAMARAAFARAAEGSIGIVGLIAEVLMPDGDGLELLRWARTLGYAGPALVCTALHEPQAIERACALGAQYVVKPAPPEAFRSFVEEAAHALVASWRARYGLTAAEAELLAAAARGLAHWGDAATQPHSSKAHLRTQARTLLAKTGDSSLIVAAARLLRERSIVHPSVVGYRYSGQL